MFIPAWIKTTFTAGAGGCIVFVLTLGYWLGIPLLNDRPTITLPVIGKVNISALPVLGPLAVGHLQLAKDEAAEAAIKDMVSAARLSAAEAEKAALLAQLARAESLKERAEAETERLYEKAEEDRNALEAATEADAGGDAAVWTDGDRQWLCKHKRRYC